VLFEPGSRDKFKRGTTAMPQTTQLIYIHDPMCSWCYGFSPVFDRLCRELEGRLPVSRLLGGLAPDSADPMPDDLQRYLQDTWRRIQQRIPGTPFNFDFWRLCRPRRSTWPACRAVIAARQLDGTSEVPMIEAIQHAYYREARNPSDDSTLVALAGGLGIDATAFAAQLDAPHTHEQLAREIARARQIGADSFPSLRLQTGASVWPVAIDYNEVQPMRAAIDALLAH
jgi:putative protein-disulfide isomerase